MLLHPKGHAIQPDDIGLVISTDIRTTFAISNYGNKSKAPRFWTSLLSNKSREPQYTHSPRDPNVESVIKRWKRTGTVTTANFNTDSILLDPHTVQMLEDRDSRTFPITPEGNYNLESQLRSVIHKTHIASGQEKLGHRVELDTLPSWLNERYGSTQDAGSTSNNKTRTNSRDRNEYPKGMSLEKATEKLLAWPPASTYGQPHPAVLERREDVILEDLKKQMISVVQLNEPHILLCCQGSWPRHLFYFIKGLRKPHGPNPPIVMLHPCDPSAQQWGLIGIFKDVFFLKGSPIYELDLMRGGILQAGFSHTSVPRDFTRLF